MYTQVADKCDQETSINVVYEEQKIYVYSNKCTVMNRMVRKFPNYKKEEYFTPIKEVVGLTMQFPMSDMKYILNGSIFKAK